jgi:GT2 family glycosyltransferase
VPAVETMLARLQAAGMRALYLPSTQRGKPAGLNRGLERVETRFVAMTDDDCLARADWLETLVDRLHREPGTIWTGRVEAAGHEVAFSTVLRPSPQRYTRPKVGVHPFAGGNAGMAMDVLRRVGGFDEHPCLAAAAEDNDFGYRALRLGIPIVYDPDVVLHHYHWRNEQARADRYVDYARSQGAFYGTHLRRGDLFMFLQVLRALPRGPLRWVRGLVSGDAEMLRSGSISTRHLLPGVLVGLRRKQSPTVSGDLGRGGTGRAAAD